MAELHAPAGPSLFPVWVRSGSSHLEELPPLRVPWLFAHRKRAKSRSTVLEGMDIGCVYRKDRLRPARASQAKAVHYTRPGRGSSKKGRWIGCPDLVFLSCRVVQTCGLCRTDILDLVGSPEGSQCVDTQKGSSRAHRSFLRHPIPFSSSLHHPLPRSLPLPVDVPPLPSLSHRLPTRSARALCAAAQLHSALLSLTEASRTALKHFPASTSSASASASSVSAAICRSVKHQSIRQEERAKLGTPNWPSPSLPLLLTPSQMSCIFSCPRARRVLPRFPCGNAQRIL